MQRDKSCFLFRYSLILISLPRIHAQLSRPSDNDRGHCGWLWTSNFPTRDRSDKGTAHRIRTRRRENTKRDSSLFAASRIGQVGLFRFSDVPVEFQSTDCGGWEFIVSWPLLIESQLQTIGTMSIYMVMFMQFTEIDQEREAGIKAGVELELN